MGFQFVPGHSLFGLSLWVKRAHFLRPEPSLSFQYQARMGTSFGKFSSEPVLSQIKTCLTSFLGSSLALINENMLDKLCTFRPRLFRALFRARLKVDPGQGAQPRLVPPPDHSQKNFRKILLMASTLIKCKQSRQSNNLIQVE